jgi:hypothetical protein
MCHLQELHEQFKDKGLVILGFNSADDKKIALEFLAENRATFPTIIDSSDAAVKVNFEDYKMSGVPVNYIIDREGKIVDAWYGYEQGHRRAKAALAKAGVKASPSSGRGLLSTLADALEMPEASARRSAPAAQASPRQSAPAAQAKASHRRPEGTWSISLHLDAPSLSPQAVQWALLDEDPVPAFHASVKRMQDFNRQQLDRAAGDPQKEIARNAAMAVPWDLGFKVVTGDHLHLLTSMPGASHATALTSSLPGGKKWIATKTVSVNGKPVCWCVPVEVKTGDEINLTLSESNRFDLGAAFDNAMRDTKPAK